MWSAMRASYWPRLAFLAAALCLGAAGAAQTASPAKAGVSALDPAFRLPSGGLALAGPVMDSSSSPAAAWLLSEDLSLYALSESGVLAAKLDLSASSSRDRPGSMLSIDPFGRVVVVLGGARLSAYTRIGALAWQARIEPVPGAAADFAPAFGSDGRAFALSGQSLICLAPSGGRLWSLPLSAPASCPPGVDGRGYPCVGLSDGSLVMATPYGEETGRASLGAAPRLLFPISFPAGGGEALPCLAVALPDGSLLLVGPKGEVVASYRSAAEILSLAWDGAVLYALDASGSAFALSAMGTRLWAASTGCLKGRLYLFDSRLVAAGQGRAVSLSLGGEVFRELGIPGASGIPAVSPAGLAFSAGADWVLAAYRFEGPLGAPRLPEFPPYPPPPDVVSKALLFDPFAADPDRQLSRMADIEKSLRSGTIGEAEPEAAAYCSAVATRALDRELSQAERRRGGSPLTRSRACYLLGVLGSPAYREPLFAVLEADEDPAVRASACAALAAMAVDKDGRSMAAFLAAASRPVDERTALVIVAAIEGMALRSGLSPSEDGLWTLIALMGKPYAQNVRNRASAALGRISGTIK
jgi:hypothetical protein